jgi:hypothetical protein
MLPNFNVFTKSNGNITFSYKLIFEWNVLQLAIKMLKVAPIYHISFVNHLKNNMNLKKCVNSLHVLCFVLKNDQIMYQKNVILFYFHFLVL